jgi:citrate lyase subunit beta/citryl-CoA lyase
VFRYVRSPNWRTQTGNWREAAVPNVLPNGARWPCVSWLISTVENEKFVIKQRDSAAHAVILELEAGTFDKDLARELAAKALRDNDYGTKYTVLRINPVAEGMGELDLEAALGSRPAAVMLPKIHDAAEVEAADELVGDIEERNGIPRGSTEFAIMMETANCIFEVREIARASSRTRALCFGPGDFTAEIGTRFTYGTAYPAEPGLEVLTARSLVVAGARATGVTAIDGPTMVSVRDTRSLLRHAWQSRALGFEGMIVLSPTQVAPLHEAFAPSPDEVGHARRALALYEAAQQAGAGVVGADAEMISATVAEQYRDVLRRAEALAPR